MTTSAQTGYHIQGDLIEACSCAAPCPCWVADDPDDGSCQSFTGYHIYTGTIRGVDVSNLSLVSLVQIPGNVTAGNWREVLFVDANATDEQVEALLDAYQGRLGGDLAGLAGLIGERVATYRVPIEYTIVNGKGTIRVNSPQGNGYAIEAVMEPYRGPDGNPTMLINSSYSTIPGNSAFLGKASTNTISVPEHQMSWSYTGRNAIQGHFDMHTD